MTEKSTSDFLEERISKLERLVYGATASDPENKCIESLMIIQNRVQSAVTGREKITTIFSKLDDLEKYLNPEFQVSMTLSESAKLNLVLLEEERIRNAVDSLQTVKDLVQYLDSEHIKATPSFCPKLYELSEMQIKQQEDVSQLSEETRNLIAKYDSIVMSLSKQFILWDTMLTEIEKGKVGRAIS